MATPAGKGNGPATAEAKADGSGGQGEYAFGTGGPTGQEWIVDAYRSLEPGNYLREFTSRGVRPDGRMFSACRPVKVQRSVLTRNSYGSAMVSLGGADGRCTRAIAACTLLVGHPSPAAPDEGDIDVTLTASPLSGPRFDIAGRESGDVTSGTYGAMGMGDPPPLPANLADVVTHVDDGSGTNATPSPTDTKEIESWLRRVVRSSRYVNPKELGIERGVSAWRVRISLHLLNNEGNARDATLLCACAALADLRLPTVEIDKGAVRIVNEEGGGAGAPADNDERGAKRKRREGRSLTLGPPPIPLTVAVLPDKEDHDGGGKKDALLADPTHLEEDVSLGNSVTATCNTLEEIVEFHKKGSVTRLSVKQVAAVACMGFGRAKELEGIVLGR